MALLFFIVAPTFAAPAPDDPPAAAGGDVPVFRTGVSDVRVDAQVTENGKILEGLSKEDFIILDEGQGQTPVYFNRDSQPLSLLLLLDISGSMQKWIDQISRDARSALRQLRPGDRVAIMVFGKRTAIHQDFSDNLAETARQISDAVRDHDVGAGTAINQAIIDAGAYMDKNAHPGDRRAILILTDNLSMSYMLPDEQVVRVLEDAETSLNAIVVGRGIRPGPPKPGEYVNPDFTPADVFHLADQTGGEAVKSSEAGSAFREMLERIRSRYTLAYHAPEAKTGTFRHIQVSLSPLAQRRYPLAEIHARSGYWVK